GGWDTAPDAHRAAAEKTAQGRLQGASSDTAAEVDGKKASDDEVKKIGIKLEFAGDKVLLTQGGSELAAFKLDPTREPKEIDLIVGKTDVHKAIYRFDGDTLTVCKSHPPLDRPTAFASKPGSKWPMLLVFRRSGEPD